MGVVADEKTSETRSFFMTGRHQPASNVKDASLAARNFFLTSLSCADAIFLHPRMHLGHAAAYSLCDARRFLR